MPSPTKNPWFKFFSNDWRADPALRGCSYAARGLWADMLTLMHEADPYGHLVSANGKQMTPERLARQTGGELAEVVALLGELEAEGVFSRNKAGTIYSRRMVRDEKKARIARENGKMGGNPTLSKTTGIPASDNPGDKPQSPEAREEEDSGLRPAAEAAPRPADPIPFPITPKQQLFSPAVLGKLIEATGRPEFQVREFLGKALRDIGAGQALEIAIEALKATTPWEYLTAAYATRKGTRRQVKPARAYASAAQDLDGFLNDPNYEIPIGVPFNG